MSKSCKGLAEELVKCLSESECVKVQKRPYRECAKEKSPLISKECMGLRETYFNCKRGQHVSPPGRPILHPKFSPVDVDMRARIRGNKGDRQPRHLVCSRVLAPSAHVTHWCRILALFGSYKYRVVTIGIKYTQPLVPLGLDGTPWHTSVS
ncbi:hypothetical protein M9H77_29147 [Catharanthus roseus]|uniref:Uncharacterized protein n=1 Tax=Catharanthus roseus TaxID=4058 RepID=A0ACC0AHQ3_CATRO|nr:hypothetical protein M9H77_29147 [Catharanthus roseus]